MMLPVKTSQCVGKYLLEKLEQMVMLYFGKSAISYMMAANGEYENCYNSLDCTSAMFQGACFGGYIEVIELAMAREPRNYDNGLGFACLGGQQGAIDFMIALGAKRCTHCKKSHARDE